jgi:hypothetical protein
MCTDDQWLPRRPQKAMMLSKFWKFVSGSETTFNTRAYQSYWLTPLDVPQGEQEYTFAFPTPSPACLSHLPPKLK